MRSSGGSGSSPPTLAQLQDAHSIDAASSRLWAAAAGADVVRAAPRPAEVLARARAAVLGAVVADAAAMSLHWVYDLDVLRAAVKNEEPAFLDPPVAAVYQYPLGRSSPYGQQSAALLASLAEARGWSPQLYAARSFDAFASPTFVSSGGYVDASTRGFLSACLAGREVPHTGVHDDQANAFARLPPLVAALAGDARLLPAVRSMVRVTQDSACAAAHGAAAARVLEAIVLGATPAEAVRAAAAAPGNGGDCDDGDDDDEEGRAALRSAIALESEAHADAVAELGRHCHLPASLACAAHAVLTHCDYAAAVRDTILQGGCNASRAGFIGACFAAAHGTGAIPPAWRSACATYERTAVLAAWATGGG